MLSTIEFRNLTRVPIPRARFSAFKNSILGKNYALSVAFVSGSDSKRLHRDYHGKNSPTNILSFPLGKSSGEIIIDPVQAKKEAHNFDRTHRKYLEFLFIHGCTHLKGLTHGSKMERIEERVRQKFGV